MKPVNLYDFSKTFFLGEKPLSVYEKFNSKRSANIQIKTREIDTIQKLISALDNLVAPDNWDGFYYSFSIPQISKEFDLLKLGDNKVLNVELKSEFTSYEKLLKQLLRNDYYLSHLNKELTEMVYVADRNIFYLLKDGGLAEISVDAVAEIINATTEFYDGDIEALFSPSQFLVSPITTPEKFISGNYFLTMHQETIRNAIIEDRKSGGACAFYQITGGAGTGKTLLIYDVAKKLAQTKNICVIHCADLADGHDFLNKNLRNVTIFPISDLHSVNFGQYDGFIIDESHRLTNAQLNYICDKIKALNKFCVFGADGEQYLSKTQAKDNISEKIYNLEGCRHFQLTNKIRTNHELADFIHLLRKIYDPVRTKAFPNVKVIYADTDGYAAELIARYGKKGYTHIGFTQSAQDGDNGGKTPREEVAQNVAGREFDKVLMVIDENFAYSEDGSLGTKDHPAADYLFEQLLYQGLTRVREKLIIIVLNNKDVFEKLLGAIKNAARD